jgi:hypothetical protein
MVFAGSFDGSDMKLLEHGVSCPAHRFFLLHHSIQRSLSRPMIP